MKATWSMNAAQLARTWAAHYGYTGRAGGWIYSPTGRPIAHGWDSLSSLLAARGLIRVGSGINYRAADLRPTLLPR